MSLAFDTCILIDILRGRRPEFRDRLLDLVANEVPLNLSAVVVHELFYGVFISSQPDAQSARVSGLLDLFQVQPWTADDAVWAAGLRADLKRLGRPIGDSDALIAGQALARSWTLVTSNVREFARVTNLQIDDWSLAR